MIILINVLSKFLNCLKSLKPQWTVHITSQLQWLKLIYRLIWSQLFSSESAGFSSCCCLVSAQHPIKCHRPQRTAEFNKAWNSSSLLANGQILHPVPAAGRDAGMIHPPGAMPRLTEPHCIWVFASLSPKKHRLWNSNVGALLIGETWECFNFYIFIQSLLFSNKTLSTCNSQAVTYRRDVGASIPSELSPSLADHSWEGNNGFGRNHQHQLDFQMLPGLVCSPSGSYSDFSCHLNNICGLGQGQ